LTKQAGSSIIQISSSRRQFQTAKGCRITKSCELRWGESGTTGRRYEQKVAGRTYVFTRNHESGRADRKPRSGWKPVKQA
jgi:hypothetical protein